MGRLFAFMKTSEHYDIAKDCFLDIINIVNIHIIWEIAMSNKTLNKPKSESWKRSRANMKLNELYSMCVTEIGIQQSKRDQILALYIAFLGIGATGLQTVFSDDKIVYDLMLEAGGFIIIAFVGIMLSLVVVRYRVYKEIYWVTSRVILQLYHVNREDINKEVVQSIFKYNLRKNMPSVIVAKKNSNKNDDIVKIDVFKTLRKIANSSESLLFVLQAALTAFSLGLGVGFGTFYIHHFVKYSLGIGIAAFLIAFVLLIRVYYIRLVEVYKCFCEEDESKARSHFNRSFHKAWFIHFYIDEDLEKELDSIYLARH